MKGIALETERLLLRTARAEDARAIYAYRSRPDVGKYQSRHRRLADTIRIIRQVSKTAPNTPDTWYQLAVIEKRSGGLIGDLGIHFTGKENRQAELAYTLAPEYQGKGYAAEAVLRLMAYLFGKLKKHRLVATADPRNDGSLKLMARVGMRREGYFRKSFWTGKEWTDDVLYALLKEEWPVIKAGLEKKVLTFVAAMVFSAGGISAAAPGEISTRSGAAGQNRSCTKNVVVTGMHYPEMTCAQSKEDFLDGMMTSYHFISKCQAGVLLAVYDVSCQDMPLHGFSSGSVYKGTACCGKVPPAKACEQITDPEVCVATYCKDSGNKCVLTAGSTCACATRSPARKCAKTVAVSGLHDPDATTCAQRMAAFTDRIAQQVKAWDKPGTFSSLCLPAQRLLSVHDITCAPAPLPEYPGGSLYGGTACCGAK